MGMMNINLETNKEIDKVLESGARNCLVVLTSRPGYVGDDIRKKMDFEVTIEGLSGKNIKKCSKIYLDEKKKSKRMLKQAKAVGIYKSPDHFFHRVLSQSSMSDESLLRVPILLLMTCFIYEENQSLPKTRNGILKTLYKLLGNRSAVKTHGNTSDVPENMLSKLGKLAWDALKRDELTLLKVSSIFYGKGPCIYILYIEVKTEIIFFLINWI